MNRYHLLFLLFALSISCAREDEIQEEIATGMSWIKIESSSYKLPLNEYGEAILKTRADGIWELTKPVQYYVDDQELDANIFRPSTTGTYKIYGVYKNLKSKPITIRVEEALNKKVLIEFFTSRRCGFCPWFAHRLDSLQQSNEDVISYAIHGQDELEINETLAFEDYLRVYERPSVRVERGYVRNFAPPIEIDELIDSIHHFLSIQPKVEISVESNLNQSTLSIKTFAKFYENIKEDIFMTLMLIEDGIITQNQYNYFHGYPNYGGPFITMPSLIPDYRNANVLRRFLTNERGDLINQIHSVTPVSQEIGSVVLELDPEMDPANTSVIAVIHKRQEGIEASAVLNAQWVKVGENVGFSE